MTDDEQQRKLSRRELLGLVGTAGGTVLTGWYLSQNQPFRQEPPTEERPTSVEPSNPPQFRGPPDGTESIADHGGTVGVDTPEAAEENVAAIHRASTAADTSTVYLPPGKWYVGKRDEPEFLNPGKAGAELGAAGLGFVGEGPDLTFLVFQKDTLEQGGGNEISYVGGTDHGDVVWRDLTYDGNYQNMAFDSGTRQWGIDIEGDTTANFTLQNFRLRNIQALGLTASGSSDFRLTVDQSTFRNIGIGRVNQADGSALGHALGPTVPAGRRLTVTNSRFELISGNVIDFSRSDGFGSVLIQNCFATGIGDTLIKEKGMQEVHLSNVFYQAHTPELESAMNQGAIEQERHGRGFLKQISGPGNGTTYVLENVEARNMLRRAVNLRNGKHWRLRGGRNGPIRIRNVNMNGSDESYVWRESTDPQSYFEFDIGTMITDRVQGLVFDCPSSRGVVDTLYQQHTSGIGSTGRIEIGSQHQRAAPMEPNVPSRNAVGINPLPVSDRRQLRIK
ncbi:hypothetical protein [Haloarcula sebkhae]|uniref:Uncharacterized protein n=2 Tax=Haloarcula sebkhae TaxID=932660 RepID=A0ACC6VNV4_9EURY|nr:hypothetical protein [Haloarcula sebkhae]GGK72686.1 hypothetical protein GCM10009067_26190 [Haloarcula sebkhae]